RGDRRRYAAEAESGSGCSRQLHPWHLGPAHERASHRLPGRDDRLLSVALGVAQSLTSILPVFSPLNSPRKASSVLSRPSTTVSRDLTVPFAIHGAISA